MHVHRHNWLKSRTQWRFGDAHHGVFHRYIELKECRAILLTQENRIFGGATGRYENQIMRHASGGTQDLDLSNALEHVSGGGRERVDRALRRWGVQSG